MHNAFTINVMLPPVPSFLGFTRLSRGPSHCPRTAVLPRHRCAATASWWSPIDAFNTGSREILWIPWATALRSQAAICCP